MSDAFRLLFLFMVVWWVVTAWLYMNISEKAHRLELRLMDVEFWLKEFRREKGRQ